MRCPEIDGKTKKEEYTRESSYKESPIVNSKFLKNFVAKYRNDIQREETGRGTILKPSKKLKVYDFSEKYLNVIQHSLKGYD